MDKMGVEIVTMSSILPKLLKFNVQGNPGQDGRMVANSVDRPLRMTGCVVGRV
jgi:hypothetical protein